MPSAVESECRANLVGDLVDDRIEPVETALQLGQVKSTSRRRDFCVIRHEDMRHEIDVEAVLLFRADVDVEVDAVPLGIRLLVAWRSSLYESRLCRLRIRLLRRRCQPYRTGCLELLIEAGVRGRQHR